MKKFKIKKLLWVSVLLVCGIGLYIFFYNNKTQTKEIKLGSSLPLSGINKKLGIAFRDGASSYFKYANESGILNGKKVKFIYYDDKYEPELTTENLHKLLYKDKIFALFGFVGTPTIKSIMPLVEESKIPFIAPFSGASFLRSPKRKNFINFRSSYDDEVDKIVKYLFYKKHISRIAIFYQNDDYGYDGYIATIKSLKKRGLSLVSEGTYKRNTLSVTQALTDIYSKKPQAIIMIGAYKPVALFIKRYRKMKNSKNTIYCNISFVNADELVKELEYKTQNMIFSQTVPFYNNLQIPVVKEYRKILKSFSQKSRYSFVSLEAYLNAKITIQALANIKGVISRETFLKEVKEIYRTYKDKKIFGNVFLYTFQKGKFVQVNSKNDEKILK